VTLGVAELPGAGGPTSDGVSTTGAGVAPETLGMSEIGGAGWVAAGLPVVVSAGAAPVGVAGRVLSAAGAADVGTGGGGGSATVRGRTVGRRDVFGAGAVSLVGVGD
jgi:hypothetical protein